MSRAARFGPLQSLVRDLRGERILVDNLIVGLGTGLAGALGVAFQSVASHSLQPADYGSVFTVVTLMTLIGLPFAAFTLLMARETSRDRVNSDGGQSVALLITGTRVLLLGGFAICTGSIVLSPALSRLFAVPAELLVAGAIGIPFSLALPLLLGRFQGDQHFAKFAGLLVGQAGLKLAAAVLLGLVWGPVGIILGISLASGATYLLALALLRQTLASRSRLSSWRPSLNYLAVVLPSGLCLAVLLGADVVIAKHYFPAHQAGEYSVTAAIGRAIFWVGSAVAAVVFPKVVLRVTQMRSGRSLAATSVFLVALAGLAGFLILVGASRSLVIAFSGPAYAMAAEYLPLYSIGMTLLGSVAVLISIHQSSGRADFLAVLVPLTALEPAVLLAFHQSIWQVIATVDVSMAVIGGALAILLFVREKSSVADASREAADSAEVRGLARSGIVS
jgi:O-antigen/teichoic acid export membrane protein